MKRVLINIFIIISMLLIYTSVNASTNLELSLESNKKEIKAQDEVILTLKTTKSIEVDKVINVYKATIEYDKSVFEEISDSSFHCQNSWSNLKYNEKNNQFIFINQENNSSTGKILQLHLKVKEKANVGDTSVKIKDIVASYGEYDISIKSQNINLKISDYKKEENSIHSNKTDSNKVTEDNKKTEKNTLGNIQENNDDNVLEDEQILNDLNSVDKEQAEDKTDRLQDENNQNIVDKKSSSKDKNNQIGYIILLIILIVLIISIIVFIKNKKIKKKLVMLVLAIFCINIININVLASTNQIGDINNDSVINISDIEILEEILIKLKNIYNTETMDINKDGKINITDLSLLIKRIKEKPVEEKNTKTAQEAVEEMKIGWNLGNTLDSCDYKKKHLVTYYETHWGNPVTTKSMIDEIKKAGFNSVRVPVTYYDHINDDGIIDEEWFDRVEEVVNYVLDNDMYCVMDIHHDTGLYEGGSWIRADADKYEENAKKLADIWKQIAVRFKDYDYKLVFEGFNEIVDTNKNYDWVTGYDNTITVNKLNQVFVDTVRQTGGKNTDRFLVVSTFGAITDEQKLSTFVMPKDVVENKIMLALHDYSNTTSGIDKMLARIEKYCVNKNIPVILNEFGTTSSIAEDKRAEIANYYVSKAKKIGVTCFWWDNGGSYQLFNRRNMNWAYPKIKDALIKGSN